MKKILLAVYDLLDCLLIAGGIYSVLTWLDTYRWPWVLTLAVALSLALLYGRLRLHVGHRIAVQRLVPDAVTKAYAADTKFATDLLRLVNTILLINGILITVQAVGPHWNIVPQMGLVIGLYLAHYELSMQVLKIKEGTH